MAGKSKKKPRLTERQRRVVDEYLITGNGAESARLAGYSASCAKETASTILTYPNVQDLLQRKREALQAENADKREFFISHLQNLALTAEKQADQLRATEMLLKAQGWNSPEKQEIAQFSGTFLADLDLEKEAATFKPLDSEENLNKINDLH
jgi:phage terminase small subunit